MSEQKVYIIMYEIFPKVKCPYKAFLDKSKAMETILNEEGPSKKARYDLLISEGGDPVKMKKIIEEGPSLFSLVEVELIT